MARSAWYPIPRRSITPGRKFSITTSARATNRETISIAAGFCRSSVRLRLLPLIASHDGAMPRSAHSRESGVRRMSSPSRRSTLMTSAPSNAS
jgi:hypothetical protein